VPSDALKVELQSVADHISETTPLAFSPGMLDSWGGALARETAVERGLSATLWGGAASVGRVVAAFHLPGVQPSPDDFPLSCCAVSFDNPYAENHASMIHRALRAALPEESRIGDIFTSAGEWFAFLRIESDSSAGNFEVTRAGSAGLSFALVQRPWPVPDLGGSRIHNTTVSSLRVDSLLSAAFKPSRSQMSRLAEAALVFVNDTRICRKNVFLKEGDTAIARGYGRLKVLAVSGETRRGRQRVSLEIDPVR